MTLAATQVMPPSNPGATPVIPEGATGPKAATILYAHDTATLDFNTFWNTYRALWQQLLGAVEDNLVRVKHRPHRGYIGSIMMDPLTHIYETYTVISNIDWLANGKSFRKAYTPTNPIEVVWHQINDAVTYSDADSIP